MSTLTHAALGLPLTTVQAGDLKPGDLIGGTTGEWLEVINVWVDPNVRHKVADVDVVPVAAPDRPHTWPIDAAARVAILRTDAATWSPESAT